MDHILKQRAIDIELDIDTRLLDDNGILRGQLLYPDLVPYPLGYFGADKSFLKVNGYENMDLSDFINYENSGMVQGAFLAAMSYKYRVTGDADALEKARRTFQGIRYIYEISQNISEGFFCKPWGGKLSDETSSDQYIYSMTGMDAFFDLADLDEQLQIAEMIEKMTRFWKKRDYSYKYYGSLLNWQKCRFTGFMALAYKYSGKIEFLNELRRLEILPEVKNQTPFNADIVSPMWSENWQDIIGRHHIFKVNAEAVSSSLLSFEPILANGLERDSFYHNMLGKIFDYGCSATAPDGLGYSFLLYDSQHEKLKPLEVTLPNPTNENWHFSGFIAPFRRGGMATTMFARAAVRIHKYLPDIGADRMALNILNKIDRKHLTWYEDPMNCFPDDLKWMSQSYSGDAAAHWLWAYWERLFNKKNE
jgi:hypothetical protein